MVYDLTNRYDLERFKTRVLFLIAHPRVVELADMSKRSTKQNSYLHLILGVLALETGNRLEYVKQKYWKEIVCPEIFIVENEDKILGRTTTLRSSKELTKEEMSTAIDRLKVWSAEQGIYLPDPEDEEALRQIEIEMRKNAKYL